MSIRINTNVIAQKAQSSLKQATAEQNDAMEMLSSGKRINKAADDAAGMAMASKMESEIVGSRQAQRNAQDGVSLVQTAVGSLNEVSSLLTRMRELSVQAASGILSKEDRSYVQIEFEQLSNEVDRISQSTNFNGAQLINGEANPDNLSFQVGTRADNIIEFDASKINATTDGLGIDGSSVSSISNARDAIEELDGALSKVNKHRAGLGSMQRRLESAVSNLDSSIINKEAAKSRIMDADVAKVSADLAIANIKASSGMSVLAQANTAPKNAQKLIG